MFSDVEKREHHQHNYYNESAWLYSVRCYSVGLILIYLKVTFHQSWVLN